MKGLRRTILAFLIGLILGWSASCWVADQDPLGTIDESSGIG